MDDLVQLADEQAAKAAASAHGRSAHLLVHDGVLRQTVIALTAGTALDEHNAPSAASLQVLRGRVSLTIAGRRLELSTGQLHPIPQERHGLLAHVDSVVLLTAVTN
ncbi:LuxR family transcriptional regulator [Kitasatospora herbaricolor]|uniref:Cupin n=1 Tax=Kitasatospora herbaricolor TaxID=68217 RepID=A0ABZ1WBI5_9ACTN|nr:cupin [Kitasatospora herbaricolor]MDQ0309156.1 quercetin dioxygenase-like cupin family protein [Kitasatospora herbaricolor]GGV03389.1 LuxR family transcriptional regulator [Kitasatospora herbaricolor]